MKYRAEIDGLRAFAVLSVIAFHAFPTWLKGGFVGVDVFFVISGFLITGIIFEELDRGTFSFANFFGRRIRRIFPALILVMTVLLVFGWFAFLVDEYAQLGKHIAGGAAFILNFILWNEVGYFDNAAETKPLLHLWSLSVEEQFYILWPLVLWFAWKKHLNLLTLTVIVALSSFAFSVSHMMPAEANFYWPLGRFWELMSGSILAWLTLYKRARLSGVRNKIDGWLARMIYSDGRQTDGAIVANVMSLSGLLLLVYSVIYIHKELYFPGEWAAIPVSGAVLVIAAGSKAWFNRVFLMNRLAVWFGLISYPLYLWHWPILSVLQIIEGEIPDRNYRIAAVVLAVVLAWLTYQLLERPIRLKKRNKTIVFALAFAMIVVGSAGYGIYSRDGLGFRIESFAKISKAAGEWGFPGKMESYVFQKRRFFRQKSERNETTLFVGDSNMEQYYVRFDELINKAPQETNSIIFSIGGGCLPVPASPYDDKHKHCFGLMETALQLALENPDVKNVVIGGQWNGYLTSGFALEGSFGVGSDLYKSALDRLSSYIKELRKADKKVFVILNIPVGQELDPKYMAQRSLASFPNILRIRDGGIERESLEKRFGVIQNDLQLAAEAAGAVVIRPLDFVCNDSRCPAVDDDGEPMYKDGAHLRPYYVRHKAGFVDITVTSAQ